MKTSYSESELKEKANEIFEAFPNANKVFATTDGNVFLEKNRAELHAGSKGKVYPFDRPTAAGNADEITYPMNAKNTIKAIKAAEKLEDLEQYKTDERESVIAALAEKTTQLTESAE